MAANRLICNNSDAIIQAVSQGSDMIRNGSKILNGALAAVMSMKDGDGSQAAHYDMLADRLNFESGDYADENTAAKKLADELNSAAGNAATAAAAAAQLSGYLGLP